MTTKWEARHWTAEEMEVLRARPVSIWDGITFGDPLLGDEDIMLGFERVTDYRRHIHADDKPDTWTANGGHMDRTYVVVQIVTDEDRHAHCSLNRSQCLAMAAALTDLAAHIVPEDDE